MKADCGIEIIANRWCLTQRLWRGIRDGIGEIGRCPAGSVAVYLIKCAAKLDPYGGAAGIVIRVRAGPTTPSAAVGGEPLGATLFASLRSSVPPTSSS